MSLNPEKFTGLHSLLKESIEQSATFLKERLPIDGLRAEQLAAAIYATRSGATQIKKNFGLSREALGIKYKSDRSPQTIVDLQSARRMLTIMRRAFPRYRINDEEMGASGGGLEEAGQIYQDPLDGTIPFVGKEPFSCNGLVVYEKGRPVLAVVCAPFDQPCPRVYFAQEGKGAYALDLNSDLTLNMNNRPQKLAVSTETDSNKSVIYVDGYYTDANRKPKLKWKEGAGKFAGSFREIGSNINQWIRVACGATTIATLTDCMGGPHDAAAMLIVKEAGGFVANINGEEPQPSDQLIMAANTPELRDQLVALAKQNYPQDYNKYGFRGKPKE